MTISPGPSTVSRVWSTAGRTKSFSTGRLRGPFDPATVTVAWSATSGEAVSDGWTMKQPDPPKIAW